MNKELIIQLKHAEYTEQEIERLLRQEVDNEGQRLAGISDRDRENQSNY